MNSNTSYKKLYIIAIFLLVVFLLTFFTGFTLFAVKILGYKLSTAIICSTLVNLILFRDFAKLSALIVVQFMKIESIDEIPDNKIIRIKDYLKKKGRLNEQKK